MGNIYVNKYLMRLQIKSNNNMQLGILFNNNMELPSTERPSTWEFTGENIPYCMYSMMLFDVDGMEDGKPVAKNPPTNTDTATASTTDTPSLKQRYLSYIQRNEAKFCDKYDSDGKNGPCVPERIMIISIITCPISQQQQTTENRKQTTDNRQQTTDNRQQTTDNPQ